jgi:hypothetical protein
MYVWYSTNEYNFEVLKDPPPFEPTLCAGCGTRIVLPDGGYSSFEGKEWCARCGEEDDEAGNERNRGVDPLTSISDEEGLLLGELVRATVRDQIKANDPPETGSTLRRLLAAGFDERNAIEHITAVLAAETYDVMNEGREFDLKKYIRNLRRLPDLPEDSDA